MNDHIICLNCQPLADTQMPAVVCGSLSQSFQWLSPVRQTKSTEPHLSTGKLFLASVAACDKTPAMPPNQWIEDG